MLNWNSLTSIKYKTGLTRCLLNRSDKICSGEKQKEIEKEQLRTLLLRNNYPVHVINKEFETFEKNITFVNLEKQTEIMETI